MNFADKAASSEAEKSASRQKEQYDSKVRESTVDIGDRVLTRKVGLKGKNKLADKWDKFPYIVVGQPDRNIPVYNVQRESGDESMKTLHRNMLLPFGSISSFAGTDESLLSNNDRLAQRGAGGPRRRATVSVNSSSSDSDSDTEAIIVPVRRRSRPISTANDSSGTNGNVSEYRNSSIPLNSHDTSSFTISDRNGDQTYSVSQYSDPTAIVEPSDVVLSITEAAPRRSGRARKPPDRYGDWIVSQAKANVTDNQTEIFV